MGTLTWGAESSSPAMRIWAECLTKHGAGPPDPSAEARRARVDTPVKMEEFFRKAGFGSIESWEDELTASFDAESLIRMRTSIGAFKPRFDGLAPNVQADCIAEARRRMEGLAREDFVARWWVVCAFART